jgi:toxin YoeB
MRYIFVDESWEDYFFWQETDKKMLLRINELLKDISRNPFSGIGKPEPLKYKYKGFWSRRISEEHRLIYTVAESFCETMNSVRPGITQSTRIMLRKFIAFEYIK